ncbi:MAG: hypothetical protein IMZ52_05760, partial [Actinobacteria bacterium]|nr:hypothetical protein [Actinomycetota bacterium]
MDKDTLLDEYQRRIQLKIEECKEYGIVFEGDYLKDDLLLTRINKKLKDKKEELAIKKMSLKEYKADQEKQKQLQIKKLQIDREEQIKSLE